LIESGKSSFDEGIKDSNGFVGGWSGWDWAKCGEAKSLPERLVTLS